MGLAALVAGGALLALWPRQGIGPRVVNKQVRLPLSTPSSTAWTTENAFPHLKFFEPTCVVPARDGSGRLFVLERRGTIQLIQNDPQTREKRLFLDVFDDIDREPFEDDGALGLVLHPEFGQPGSPNRGYFYVWYTARVDGQRRDRLARFTLEDGRQSARTDSRLVLIDQLDEDIWHNGGALQFGPDGFLYIGVGDEGGDAPDQFANGQRIDKDLFSGILRIDVDRRGGDVSHPPPRQPETGTTQGYFIPGDNPFVGRPGALEEFWAIGLRSPQSCPTSPTHKRPVSGSIRYREEVNLVTRASNHQWSYAEGKLPETGSYLGGRKPKPYLGVETPPLLEYLHLNGDNCVISGRVYRGSQHPELVGKYIYGDNGSGRIWALEYDGEVVKNVELLSMPVSSKTGLASVDVDADGELLLVVLGKSGKTDGTLHRLVRDTEGKSSPLPRLLSQTGLFEDLRTLTPAAGVYPFDVNSPLWSDGARKRAPAPASEAAIDSAD